MKYLFAVLMLTIYSKPLLSQTPDTIKAQLIDLRTSPSPTFVLFGIEPASINKPAEPRAVGASFISAIKQGGSFEVAPYWLMAHPMLKFKDYYEANPLQTVLQTFSASFAMTPKSGNTDSLGTQVGLGGRWMFFAGDPRDSLKILHDSLLIIQNQILETEDPAKIVQLSRSAKKIALAIQRENKIRVGFQLEMAGAFSMNFLNNNFRKGTLNKWGVWLTGAYILDRPSIDILVVARMIGNHNEIGTQNVLDLGGRLVALVHDFSISIEYVNRAEINTNGTVHAAGEDNSNFFLKSTYRLAGQIEYNYNKDISAFLTFGKNYASENTNKEPITAQVGINFGFGQIPLLESK